MNATAAIWFLRGKTLSRGLVLISTLTLMLTSACQSQGDVPASTSTIPPSPAATQTPQTSPPSASWPDILGAAQARVSSVYTDAILTSVIAAPYDFDLRPGYAPATEILKVSIGFIRPGPVIINVDMADNDPRATLKLTTDDHSKPNKVHDLFQEAYDTALKDQATTGRGINSIAIAPRDALGTTISDAREHATQIGLGSNDLIPEVKWTLGDGQNSRWEVTYRLNPVKANGVLDLRKPVATFMVDAATGAIVSTQYDDAKPAFQDLYATPGFTATMQAVATAISTSLPAPPVAPSSP